MTRFILTLLISVPAVVAGCGKRVADAPPLVVAGADAPDATPPAAAAIEPVAAPIMPEIAPVADRQTFAEHVQPFFAAHCVSCHGPDEAEQELRLDSLSADFVHRPAADHWVEVLNRLNLGEMPPPDEPRPDADQLAKVTDWITGELRRVQSTAQSTGGRALLRRLSRREYANTVRDLLRVEFVEGESPLDRLPPDGSMAGFDTVSQALLIDPSLMDAYLTVARSVAEQAVSFRPPLVPTKTMRFEFRNTTDSAMAYILDGREAYLEDGMLVLMAGGARTYSKLLHPFNNSEIPVTGNYRIRVRAAADPGERGEPVYMDVSFGSTGRLARFRVDASPDDPQVYEFERTFDAAIPGEFSAGLVNSTEFGNHQGEWLEEHRQMQALFEAGQLLESTRMKARMRAEGSYDVYTRGAFHPEVMHLGPLPKLYLDWIEVTGPLQPEYPPESMQTVFHAGWSPEQLRPDYAREIFARLLPRAFRRPVHDSEVDAITALVADELQQGASFEEAIRAGVVAMLCAPDFLFLFEPGTSNSPRQLNDYEFAARLSYFLWSSLPDDELTELAARSALNDPAVVSAQVDRMLADPRAEGFVQGFARQWFRIDEFDRFPPDEQIFPDYYATDMVGLGADMEEQPLAFFREVLHGDLPVSSFLHSDWTMLNERLAKFYGIEGVNGEQFRRFNFPDAAVAPYNARGGLLGMAGVHKWGSDGNRTKPVERGKYVLDVLFNDPPPPPPPNAGEVEPNLNGERLTVRERLARHREQPTCNNCHRRIDPYGLALENFNVIGQWRDRLDGEKPLAHWGNDRPLIDASGILPDGREFQSFPDFQQLLLAQHERFRRALAEKLVVYALGRTTAPGDRGLLDELTAPTRDGAGDDTLRRFLKDIALSEAFRRK
jgi:mono/diheme cytochrome c family protein